jgi:KDO2-lipid IV(A) lauroyltransferase
LRESQDKDRRAESRGRLFRQEAEYRAVRGALWLAGKLPLEAAQRIGALLGRIGFDIVRARRSTSIANVAISLGVSRSEATRIARASYGNLGRCLMEFAAFARLTPPEVLDLVEVEGIENIERLSAEGKGGVLVSGHVGNWELIGPVLAVRGFPIQFLVGEQTNTRVDGVMNDLRRHQNLGIITRSAALRKVLQALADRQFVALLADQDARKGGIIVDFLGRPASTVRGPALFAIRRGCPILPFFVTRKGTRHHLTIESPLYPASGETDDELVRDLTQRYTDRIAAHIRLHPDEYFWPHRRWKSAMRQATTP